MRSGRVRQLTIAALIAACLAVTSWIVALLPSSVPLTLQTFFVVLAALLLRPRWAAASMLTYVGLGALGLPVFSGGRGGVAILVGPTGGYLVAFIVAAFIGSLIAGSGFERARSWRLLWRQVCAAAVMIVVIDTLGTAWLAYSAHLPLAAAVAAGVLPFLIGDVIKAAAALLLATRLQAIPRVSSPT